MAFDNKDSGRTFKLNIQMITDTMDELWWKYKVHRSSDKQVLTGCLLYCGQEDLREDILYIIPDGGESGFPIDSFSYATTGNLCGKAPHIRGVSVSLGVLINHVLTVFNRYHNFEKSLSDVISCSGSLTELCQVASRFFNNPVYIHDNMFAILAESHHANGMIDFEYNKVTRKMHIPLWLVDEFKYDETYRHTLSSHTASIWGNDQYPKNMRSIFVNLWDGERYVGRVLINEIDTSLHPGQFRAAELFADYVMLWIRNMDMKHSHRYNGFEDTFIELMTTGAADERDLHTMLSILDWKEDDQYLCIKLQNQNLGDVVCADGALNSHLITALTECVTFRFQQQLCIVVNVSRSKWDSGLLRLHLAPLIRDSCMYAGISNPINSLRKLPDGFYQTDIALDFITVEDNREWMVSFASCALSYIRSCACRKLDINMVVHPILLDLKKYDSNNGTQYYDTLHTYLLNERNIPATANALIIHRTTLTYRLGKIQEITHLNLDDANLRLYLLLSFQLLEHGWKNIGR